MDVVSFPEPNAANKDGLLAIGGDLSVSTLLKAYAQGLSVVFRGSTDSLVVPRSSYGTHVGRFLLLQTSCTAIKTKTLSLFIR